VPLPPLVLSVEVPLTLMLLGEAASTRLDWVAKATATVTGDDVADA